MKAKQTIILDMDGTIYQFNGGSFRESGIYTYIRKNSIDFISNKLDKNILEAENIFENILETHGSTLGLSVGLEREFGLNRFEYFDFAWNLNAGEFVAANLEIKPLLFRLQQEYDLVLLSDAPRVWVNNVLEYFDIRTFFGNNIFSGEGDIRKEYDNAFQNLINKVGVAPTCCISVGDQEKTDISPAKKLGMKTVFVGKDDSSVADFSISCLNELELKLKELKI